MDTKNMGPRPALVRSSTRKSGARWSLPITSFLLFMAAQQSMTLEGSPGTGRIIIVGGWKDWKTPSTPNSEVMFSFGPTLPPFPVEVHGNTLSQVRVNVYSCGGYDSSLKRINKCWVIDAMREGSAWRSFDIPWAMAQHSAVAVQDEIWLFYGRTIHIIDTRNPANEPREISLKLWFGTGICVVAHGPRTFVIGVGQQRNEVHVNNDQSKPEQWEIFSTLMHSRADFGCHEFGGEVFVTGGGASVRPSNDLPFVEAISLTDGTVRSFGPLGAQKKHRRFHQMAIIEGRLAMLGGINNTQATQTIETYDEQTNSWKTLDRTLADPRYFFGLTQFRT